MVCPLKRGGRVVYHELMNGNLFHISTQMLLRRLYTCPRGSSAPISTFEHLPSQEECIPSTQLGVRPKEQPVGREFAKHGPCLWRNCLSRRQHMALRVDTRCFECVRRWSQSLLCWVSMVVDVYLLLCGVKVSVRVRVRIGVRVRVRVRDRV